MLLSMFAPPGAPDPENLIKFYAERNSMSYVMVRNGKIVNIIAWDGTSPYTPPEGCELHAWEGFVNIGWDWIDGAPVDPNPPPPSPPVSEATPVVVLP